MPAGRPVYFGAGQRRRDPQLLGAGARRQDGHGAGPRAAPAAAGRPARRLPRPVRRVLRRAARAHGAACGGAGRRPTSTRWLAAQARPARAPVDAAAAQRGREAFLAQRCDACHTVRGVGAAGRPRPRPDARRQPPAPRRRHAAERAATRWRHWIAAHAGASSPARACRRTGDARRRDAATPSPPGWSNCNDQLRIRSRRARRRLPNSSLPRPRRRAARRSSAPGRRRRAGACSRRVNNTHIGVFYIATALLFFVLAGVLALMMRAQLAVPDNTLIERRTPTTSCSRCTAP